MICFGFGSNLAVTHSLFGKTFATRPENHQLYPFLIVHPHPSCLKISKIEPASKFPSQVAMTVFHLVTSVLAIRDSVTDGILLCTAPILADELVEAAVHVAPLLIFALRAIISFVASPFCRNALSVVALVALRPAGQPPVRALLRLVRSVPAVNPLVAQLLPVDATSSPIATELIVRTSRTTLLVAHVIALSCPVTPLPGRQAEACGGAVEASAGAVPLVRPVRTLGVPVALDGLADTGAISALVAALSADSLSLAFGNTIVLFIALAVFKGCDNAHTEEGASRKADDLQKSGTSCFPPACT